MSARPSTTTTGPGEQREPRIGRTLGFLVQLVAGTVVLVVLFTGSELISRRLLDAEREVNRRVESLHLTTAAGDPVATTVQTLQTYPAINPSPLVTDVLLLWRNEPNAWKTQPVSPRSYGSNATWRIQNSSEGYRGPEREFPGSDPNVYRVVCVGDSITFGFNVDQEDSYPRQLQRLLRERHPGRSIEVVNTGVPGWSWYQGLRFVQLEGLGLHPNLVIAAHGTNDQFLPAHVTDRERLGHLGNPVARGLLRAGAWLSRTSTYRLVAEHLPPAAEASGNSPGCKAQLRTGRYCHRLSLDDIGDAVTELAESTSRAGVTLLLLNLDFPETPAVQGSRAASERLRLPFLDFVSRFNELRTADETARASRLGLLPARAEQQPARPRVRQVMLRVQVDHPAEPVSARGYFDYSKPQFQFDVPMYDDGTHADQMAHDGVYTATVETPPAVRSLEYNFFLGEAAELAGSGALPSSMANRHLPVDGDRIAPVDVFGQLFMMAERTHPNRDGQGVVATGIADWIEQDEGFRRFLARTGG